MLQNFTGALKGFTIGLADVIKIIVMIFNCILPTPINNNHCVFVKTIWSHVWMVDITTNNEIATQSVTQYKYIQWLLLKKCLFKL